MHTPSPRRKNKVSAPILGPAMPQRKSRFMLWFGTTVLRLLGWKFEGDIPNVPKLVAIGAPHTSAWDVVIAIAGFFALDVKLAWMAKAESFNKIYGPIIRNTGGVPVDRSRNLGLVGQMIEHFNNNDQFVLALAPEGTRRKVQGFKTGFYHIAVGAKVPILCVGIDFGRKAIRFFPLIYPSGNMDADMTLILDNYKDVVGRHPNKVDLSYHGPKR